jgi:hypothetical protein
MESGHLFLRLEVFIIVICGIVVVIHGILVVAIIVELIFRCVVQIVHLVILNVGKKIGLIRGPAGQPGAAADTSAVLAVAATDTSAVQLNVFDHGIVVVAKLVTLSVVKIVLLLILAIVPHVLLLGVQLFVGDFFWSGLMEIPLPLPPLLTLLSVASTSFLADGVGAPH